MPEIQFIGQSYVDQPLSAQDTVNFIPDIVGDPGVKAKYSLRRTPGLVSFSSPTTAGQGRGMHAPAIYRASTGAISRMYYIAGNTLYSASSNGTTTSIGALSTSAGQCYFADNGLNSGGATRILMITDGQFAYYVDMVANNAVTKITDTDFTDVIDQPERVMFNDGYFLAIDKNSQNMQMSPQYWNGTDSWDATAVAVIQASPDNLVASVILQDMVWLFGTDSYEIYIDTGATVPYEAMPGAANTVGTIAPDSVATNGKNVFWVGSNAQGQNKILMNEGYNYRPISTAPIEEDITTYTAVNNAVGYCYTYRGHDTYQLTFPSGNKTWCYDISSGQWYRKTFLNNGNEDRHRTIRGEAFVEKVMVQDWEDGIVYYYDDATFTDNGSNIRRVRVSPSMPNDNKRYFYPRFELVCQTGVGLATGTTDPQVMLRVSNDGGRTFGKELKQDLGASGRYKDRVIWNRLGESRNRVWKVVITDPVDCTLMSAQADGIHGGH